MAVEQDFVRKRKRKRSFGKRKFIVGERVEVRSEEDGFLGSWHVGEITASSNHRCHVKYEHILTDNGDDKLVEIVCVSSGIGATYSADANECTRGCIRPLPPSLEFGKWSLPYGLCVDVYHNEAWWEGVIFYHEDGSPERRIFFPDLGDEMTVGIHSLRITQDWYESTESWCHRGIWLFLELIEEHEQESYLAVSVKQIWYDLREKKGYKKLKDWTSSVRSVWKELVLEVIDDNMKVVIDHFLRMADLPRSSEHQLQPVLGFNRSSSNITDDPDIKLPNSLPVVAVENLGKSNEMNPNYSSMQHVEAEFHQNKPLSISEDVGPKTIIFTDSDGTCHDKSVSHVFPALTSSPREIAGISCRKEQSSTKHRSSKQRKNNWNWEPTSPDIVPFAEFCPDAITKYAQIDKRKNNEDLVLDVKKHLKHQKWKLECARDGKGFLRQRFISPDGKCYHSLRQVCVGLEENRLQVTSPDDLDYRSAAVNSPCTDSLVVRPEYNPQAVVDWYMVGLDENRTFNLKKSDMVLKARQHLASLGWEFKYFIGSNSRRDLYHISPEGKRFFSLRSACKAYLGSKSSDARSKTLENFAASDKAEDQLASEKLAYSVSNIGFNNGVLPSHALSKNLSAAICIPRRIKLKMKRKTNSSRLGRKQANLQDAGLPIFKLADDMENTQHTCILQSSKRAKQQHIPSSSNHNPRTVLSWLIDNNVVLPRAKVTYCRRKKRRPNAEGRITRDGIKCKCCGKVYTFSGFQDHVGSTFCNPASQLFLEDGRSLLDCQLQVLKTGIIRNVTGEAHNRLKRNLFDGENDYKCSVCHYGGELILCDRCPSSFHRSCVGLEDVPDGDWFCPSCCCGICGNGNSIEEVEDVDVTVLTCHQCELKYHKVCIQNGVTTKLGTHANENWFCSKKCREIFLALQKLLGKPIPIGVPYLTWTLVKSSQQDIYTLDATEIEALSKLNIAHRVMHECFEPIHEPYSSGDLVEDVLFSRESVLNRLNFRGFYTVILERKEEVVTVATVRIFGEKAAEIPLIGTRFQYRRLGLCRFLMNELEKRLAEIGVERLILPAIPAVLKTWTTSFGFKRMTNSERVQLAEYTFLNFSDTTMCQKFLKPSAEMKFPSGFQPRLQSNIVYASGDNDDLVGSSTVSEVSKAELIEECGTVEQKLSEYE